MTPNQALGGIHERWLSETPASDDAMTTSEESMSAKDVMMSVWPDAQIEHIVSRNDPDGYWIVWHKKGDDGGLYGVGKTQEDAWEDAVRSLDISEGLTGNHRSYAASSS